MSKIKFFRYAAVLALTIIVCLSAVPLESFAAGTRPAKTKKDPEHAALSIDAADRAGDVPGSKKDKNISVVASDVDPNDPSKIGVSVGEIDKIIRNLQEKEKDGSITPEQLQSLEDYQEIRKYNQEILSDVKTMEWVYTFINMDPKNNRYLRENKEFFKELEADKKLLNNKISDADLALLIAKYTSKKESAQTAYSRVKNFYDNSSSYIEVSTAKIGELGNQIQENTNLLRELDRNAYPSRYLRLKAQNASCSSKINVTQFILNNYEISYKNLAIGVNYRQEILAAATEFLEKTKSFHAEMRRKQLSSTMVEASEEVSGAKDYPVVARLAEMNRRIQEDIELVNRENTVYEADNATLSQMIAEAKSFDEDLKNQIAYFKGTVNLARILLTQTNYYRKIDFPENFTDNLSDRRMMIYNNRNDLNGLDALRKKIYAENQAEFIKNPEIENLVKKHLDIRMKLLSELNVLLNTNTRNATNLQINHDIYERIRSGLNQQIKSALFWNPSNVSLGRKWIQNFKEKVENRDFMLMNYIVNVRLIAPSVPSCINLGFLILAFIVSFWAGWKLNTRKAEILANLVKPRKAGYGDAPLAVLADFMRALLVFLITAIAGYALLSVTEFRDEVTQELLGGHNFYETLWGLALLIAGATFFLRIYRKGGLNERLFNISYDRRFYCGYRNIFICVCAIWITVQWRINTQNIFTSDVTGQLILFLISAYLSCEFLRLVIISLRRKEVLFRKKFIIAVALVLCVTQMVITFMGYYYSAVLLCERIIVSLFIIMGYDLLRSLVKRTFRVYAIKNRLRQWNEERLRRRAGGDESPDDDDEDSLFMVQKDEISAYQVSQQTVTIVDHIFLLLLVVILLSFWGDLFTVTNYLKNFTVYSIGVGEAIKAVTAFDILLVIYALGIGTIVIKNLPGVMEVLLFNHWELLRKYNYSITTIITYLLIAVDASFVCTTLGLSWDKVQWLVAALSVGLGFGLQEIFANFVSGLILLFERPVRIGDIITINDHSGTVSRIRIRATTIMDFDHKEYVVPNRALITSALTNWTLMDTVTRVAVKVGVGYDSDMDQVRSLLMDIARRNPYVMRDPEPKMYFMSFGDSNLNVEFYVFTRKTGDRYPCIDTMNSDILKTFREHNIEIAFNQVDVYVKNVKDGQEIRIDSLESAKGRT
ncbi:mechanosensitive ion channel domain-containing protein [Succinimonas amylolytica]|uniref:mechanosensitive ion channel domain-containing protein n=1 Tax=Succinimonas amylolytica TaxID=83769 RepID=UPI0023A7C76F